MANLTVKQIREDADIASSDNNAEVLDLCEQVIGEAMEAVGTMRQKLDLVSNAIMRLDQIVRLRRIKMLEKKS